jgi:hypothetical protein
VLLEARRLAYAGMTRAEIESAVLGPDGLRDKLFTNRKDRDAYLKTDDYELLCGVLSALSGEAPVRRTLRKHRLR